MWNRSLCCEKVAATVASIAASPPRPARTQFLELPGTQRLAKWRMRYFLVCRTWRTLADSVTGRPQPCSEVTNPKTRSTTFFNDLPCVNQRGLYTERHLQPDTFCRLANSLDGRFHDSAPGQFNEHAVADFVFGHRLSLGRWNSVLAEALYHFVHLFFRFARDFVQNNPYTHCNSYSAVSVIRIGFVEAFNHLCARNVCHVFSRSQ